MGHDARITGLIVDPGETAAVSVGLDGRLCICALQADDAFDDIEMRLTHGPLTAVCFAAVFSIARFSFLIGTLGGKLLLFEQSWFAPKITEVASLAKPVTSIGLYKNFLTYSDADAVYIRRWDTREMLTAVNRPKIPEAVAARAELDIIPSILWDFSAEENMYVLHISWYNVIRIIHIDVREILGETGG